MQWNHDEAQPGLRSDLDLIFEPGAAVSSRGEFGKGLHLGHRTFAIGALYTKAERPHPFKRLLLPLDRHPENRQTDAAARVAEPALVRFNFNCRNVCVAIEAIGVSDKRPQLFRTSLQVIFPTVVKFAVGHKAEESSQKSGD